MALIDPELRRVIASWDDLSDPVKKAMLALVATAPTGRTTSQKKNVDFSARDVFVAPTADDVPALVAALKERNLQHGAALALAKVRKPEVPSLLVALGEAPIATQGWAAFAVGGTWNPNRERGLECRYCAFCIAAAAQ